MLFFLSHNETQDIQPPRGVFWVALIEYQSNSRYGRTQYQRCNAQLKGVGSGSKVKFDGNILDGWFQDKLSREKVKLSGHSGELADCKTSWGRVEKSWLRRYP